MEGIKDHNKRKIIALSSLIFIELAFGYFSYWYTKHQVSHAFLVKNGSSYILLWKGEGNEAQTRHYSYLHDALQYAHDELELQLGHNYSIESSVDQAWSRDDFEKRLVFWTTEGLRIPYRLTFRRKYEAETYLAALKLGAYTPSPFGHSLSLVPRN